MHILVVDDERIECETLQRGLRKYGHSVHKALSGQEALDALRAEPSRFELVLTDYDMPDMDGLQLVKAMRRIGGNPPPVILVTGYANDALFEKAIAYGCKGYIEKPFTPERLNEQIQEAIRGAAPQHGTKEETGEKDGG